MEEGEVAGGRGFVSFSGARLGFGSCIYVLVDRQSCGLCRSSSFCLVISSIGYHMLKQERWL